MLPNSSISRLSFLSFLLCFGATPRGAQGPSQGCWGVWGAWAGPDLLRRLTPVRSPQPSALQITDWECSFIKLVSTLY